MSIYMSSENALKQWDTSTHQNLGHGQQILANCRAIGTLLHC